MMPTGGMPDWAHSSPKVLPSEVRHEPLVQHGVKPAHMFWLLKVQPVRGQMRPLHPTSTWTVVVSVPDPAAPISQPPLLSPLNPLLPEEPTHTALVHLLTKSTVCVVAGVPMSSFAVSAGGSTAALLSDPLQATRARENAPRDQSLRAIT